MLGGSLAHEDWSLSVKPPPFCFHLFPTDWSLHQMLHKSQDADDFAITEIFLWPISGTTDMQKIFGL